MKIWKEIYFINVYREKSELPYRTKIRRTKNSANKNFRRTKFSAPFKIFGTFVRFLLDFYIVSLDKTFGGQKFSADKNFGTSSNFRQFCPPNFCPIRYWRKSDESAALLLKDVLSMEPTPLIPSVSRTLSSVLLFCH